MYEQYRSTGFFASLDGLRAISIIAVIFHHTVGHAFVDTAVEYAGGLGVHFFFAISGFLITTLLLRESDRNGRIDLPSFYVRRSLRIFPLYYTVLLLYVVLVLAMEDGPAGEAFFGNLPFFATYTSNWFVDGGEGRVIFYFAWSLATEEQFYLLWPSVEKRARRWAPVVMLVVIAAVELVWRGVVPMDEQTLAYRVITSIPAAIGFGVVLAHALHDRRWFERVRPVLGHRASAPVFFVALAGAIALVAGHRRAPSNREWRRP